MKIVLSTVAAIFLLGCSGGEDISSKEATKAQTQEIVKESTAPTKSEIAKKNEAIAKEVKELAQKSTTAATETSASIQEESEKIAKEMSAQAQELKSEIEAKSDELVHDMQESYESSKEEIKALAQTTEKTVEQAPKTKTPTIDAATLYKACASCHGANAEKKALNKSQIIKGWEASKTVTALQGYKDGSYGGAMKGIMKPQVAKLSDAEIEALAKYISNL